MGLRRLCFLLAVPWLLSLAACGDNDHKVFHDAGTDTTGSGSDAAIDAPPDALMCNATQMNCNGTCVNTQSDNTNCGTCGNNCGSGTCQSGVCCAAGQTNCGGTCVDLNTNTNCGACGNDCGTGTCQTDGGITMCCPTGQTNCNGTCVDVQSDEANCGMCGMACGGSDTCCTGSCKNTQTDNANCGMCGTICDTTMGDSCTSGTPAVCCGTGESNCSGTCSLLADNANCGMCGASCDTTMGESCRQPTAGTGVACCTASQNNCSGTCSDPMTDEMNCGTCGNSCASGETCTSGICCAPGETACNGVCVDLLTDNTHCGSCTTTCSGGTPVCNGGTCAGTCDPTETLCSGDCVNISNDPNNCGGCAGSGGMQCAANQVCSNGSCTTMCPSGTTNCNGACVNLTATPGDPNHCGTCTTVCAVGDECIAGQCQLDCPFGQQLCNGVCVDTKTDEANCGGCAGMGGMVCGSGQTCDDSLCCGTGQENVDGKCCTIGWLNCNNQCVDPETNNANCGSCNAACGSGTSCDGGICCATNLDNCSGTSCTDTQTDEANCGACNAPCATTETCTAGVCCDTLTEYNANGICCPLNSVNCNGVCTNLNSPTTCGTSCGNAAPCQSNEVCSAGVCTVNCTLPEVNCNGACVNRDSDENNCGTCGNICASGQTCTGGVCGACPSGSPTECEPPINACVNPTTDGANCGDCGTFCGGGEHCSTSSEPITAAVQSGFTATFTTATPHFFTVGQEVIVRNVTTAVFNGAWEIVSVPTTTTFTVTLTTSGSATASSQTTAVAESGDCCGLGLEACNGQCLDFTSDPLNCGSCGTTCGASSVCVNGSCQCGFGQIQCGNNCITPSVDPLNCGTCGNICGPSAPYCVSGGCIASCPAPLTGCPIGNSTNLECINTDSDSDNCGTCGNKCLGNTGCSAGQCVPKVAVGPDPGKCVGGGPPISVPDDNGTICTGNLGATSFTFGLCARTNIGPISRDLITDAFDSTSGPYVDSCTVGDDSTCGPKRCRITRGLCTTTADCPVQTGNDCDFLVKCIGGTCAGGGVGVNGIDDGVNPAVPVGPVASNSAVTHVGGAFWVFGSIGLAVKGNTDVKQRFYNQGNLDLSKTTHVWGDATVGGAWSAGGNTSMTIDKSLTVVNPTTCPPLPASVLTLTQGPTACSTAATFPSLAQPCGTRAQLIDVKKIVRHYSNPANNDNLAIGLNQNVLDNPQTSLRIDLPCGVYYFNSINAGKSVTIVVNGRTAIVVGGAIRISQKVIFDVQPNASLDIFAGGVLNVSNDTTLGSPAYPRLTRLYLGDDSCKGGGGTLTPGDEDFTDCCSGVESGGVCVAGGGNLAQSISLSQGGHFNGLLWGGYGTFTHSNPLEMYGSIFTNHFDASGETIVHYDNGAVQLGEECPQTPGACESCRDCNNQACTNNQCGSCTADSQCCPPLVCRSGTCILE